MHIAYYKDHLVCGMYFSPVNVHAMEQPIPDIMLILVEVRQVLKSSLVVNVTVVQAHGSNANIEGRWKTSHHR